MVRYPFAVWAYYVGAPRSQMDSALKSAAQSSRPGSTSGTGPGYRDLKFSFTSADDALAALKRMSKVRGVMRLCFEQGLGDHSEV